MIVFLATSYTVLFVSWVMAKMGKDTALAPAAQATSGTSAAQTTPSEPTVATAPAAPAAKNVAGKEA